MPTKLGQNFLNNTSIITQIIQSSSLSSEDFVIEIGPGNGILTEQLIKSAKKVLAIEIDDRLIPSLKEKFKEALNFELIHADILDINLPTLLEEKGFSKYKVIANIPYYITSPIIRLLLETPNQPKEIILMVQKEVAERIVAKPGKMSILSNSVQYYAQAEILFNVSREKFTPTPEVDSVVIKITPHTSFDKKNAQTKLFFRAVRAGFSAKRKTLINNLANIFQLDKTLIEDIILALKLKSTVRAQELSLENWKNIAAAIEILL